MVRPIDGKGFAFVPRSVVAQPGAFGKVAGVIEPAEGISPDDPRYRAAMLQHVLAFASQNAVRSKTGRAASDYVVRFGEPGLSADRVRRVFRGETMAQLTDICFWSTQFQEVARVVSGQIFEPPSEPPSGGSQLH